MKSRVLMPQEYNAGQAAVHPPGVTAWPVKTVSAFSVRRQNSKKRREKILPARYNVPVRS